MIRQLDDTSWDSGPSRGRVDAPSALAMISVSAVTVAMGLLLVLAAFLDGDSGSSDSSLPLYFLGLLAIGALTWWESTRPRTGMLPAWTSPPALIAGWALIWLYLPSLVVFMDEDLLDDFTLAHGGRAVLVAGLPVTCAGLAVLSFGYHATIIAFQRVVRLVDTAPRLAPLQRIVALYLISAAARVLRMQTLGVAYGSSLASWGPLQSLDQWIGSLEDLRFLALALLVVHVVRERDGRVWLGTALLTELVIALSMGFLMPVILPIVLCATTAVACDRLRRRHLVLVAAAGLIVTTFAPVIAAIRQDRLGAVGTVDIATAGDAITAPVKYWLNGVSSGNGIYDKFFGRQAEVAIAPGLVATLTPTVIPYEGLERFLMVPAGLIPRVLWPEKPTLSRGVWFSATFRGFDEDTTSYSAMTIFSEGYLFYGWGGTVLAMVIVGMALAAVRLLLNNRTLVPVYLALVPTILHIEPEFSSYLVTLVQRSVVFVFVYLLLTHTRRSNIERARVRA